MALGHAGVPILTCSPNMAASWPSRASPCAAEGEQHSGEPREGGRTHHIQHRRPARGKFILLQRGKKNLPGEGGGLATIRLHPQVAVVKAAQHLETAIGKQSAQVLVLTKGQLAALHRSMMSMPPVQLGPFPREGGSVRAGTRIRGHWNTPAPVLQAWDSSSVMPYSGMHGVHLKASFSSRVHFRAHQFGRVPMPPPVSMTRVSCRASDACSARSSRAKVTPSSRVRRPRSRALQQFRQPVQVVQPGAALRTAAGLDQPFGHVHQRAVRPLQGGQGAAPVPVPSTGPYTASKEVRNERSYTSGKGTWCGAGHRPRGAAAGEAQSASSLPAAPGACGTGRWAGRDVLDRPDVIAG